MSMGKSGAAPLHLSLTLEPELISEFNPFLQQGFQVNVRVGCSVRELLCNQLGIAEDYLTGRITTVFQDNKAIDDLDAAIVRDGSRITLSATLPGLVGATMRRGGFYAAMRDTITHRETGEKALRGGGVIRMKLFNLLLPELGPVFLQRGIGLASDDLTDFIAQSPAIFWQGCREILLNGAPLEPERLKSGEALHSGGTVWLSVIFGAGK
jgi:hypothetical protein